MDVCQLSAAQFAMQCGKRTLFVVFYALSVSKEIIAQDSMCRELCHLPNMIEERCRHWPVTLALVINSVQCPSRSVICFKVEMLR